MSRPFNERLLNVCVEIGICIVFTLLLVFTSINISNYLKPAKVLGASISTPKIITEEEFWTEFLSKNPDYIPGWIETGRFDKAKEIDPNYIKP